MFLLTQLLVAVEELLPGRELKMFSLPLVENICNFSSNAAIWFGKLLLAVFNIIFISDFLFGAEQATLIISHPCDGGKVLSPNSYPENLNDLFVYFDFFLIVPFVMVRRCVHQPS